MRQLGAAFGRFFAMRGTHLAAMVAYFALASFVPLVFLALSTLGLFGRIDESTALVSYLEDVLPGRSVDEIVRIVATVQDNARTLGIVGAVALLWSSLSLFSALESAFNIVYERPNRSFLRGKALAAAYMTVWLVAMVVGLGIGTLGTDLLRRYAADVIGNSWVALGLSAGLSALVLLVFLGSAYYRLTNAHMNHWEVLPGAALAAIVLVVTLQGLPLFLQVSSGLVALQALGTTFLLLVWLYVMANVIVFGAVFNWQLSHGRTGAPVLPRRPSSADIAAVAAGAPVDGATPPEPDGKAPDAAESTSEQVSHPGSPP